MQEDHWWQGHSPEKFGGKIDTSYKNIFFSLLNLEGDDRFMEHINCFSQLFKAGIKTLIKIIEIKFDLRRFSFFNQFPFDI